MAGGRPRRPARVLPPDPRPGVQGLRRTGTAPTSCSPRAGTPSTRCCGSTTAARAPTSSRTTSRSSSPPRPSRVLAERTYTPGCYCITGEPVAARPARDALRRARQLASSSASTTTSTARARSRAGATRSSSTRAHVTPRRAVPLGRAGARGAPAAPPGHALRAVRRREADARPPFPYEQLGVASPEELSWAVLGGDRRAVALAHELLADPAGDDGLRAAVRRARGRQHRERLRRRRADRARDAPTRCELADALERLLDDAGAARAPRRRRARVRRRARPGTTRPPQVEDGLRAALRDRASAPARRRRAPPGRRRHARGWAASRRAQRAGRPLGEPRRRPSSSSRASTRRTSRRSRRGSTTTSACTGTRGPEDHSGTLALVFGVWHGVPAVLEKTGLRPDEPPEDVHAMARGPLAAGGAVYYADMLADATAPRRRRPRRVARGLDFGCSSGRVVRALAAAWPAGRVARRATRTRRRSRGRASTCRGSSSAVSRRTRRCPTTTATFDFVVRDLDLVALRRARGAQLAGGDAPHHPPRRAARDHDARPAVDRLLRAAPASARRCSSSAIRTRAVPHGLLVRADEFGEEGDWGVRHPSGARRSSRPSGSPAKRCPRGRSRTSRSARTPTTRTSTCCAAADRRAVRAKSTAAGWEWVRSAPALSGARQARTSSIAHSATDATFPPPWRNTTPRGTPLPRYLLPSRS